jgi:hypothetical protein
VNTRVVSAYKEQLASWTELRHQRVWVVATYRLVRNHRGLTWDREKIWLRSRYATWEGVQNFIKEIFPNTMRVDGINQHGVKPTKRQLKKLTGMEYYAALDMINEWFDETESAETTSRQLSELEAEGDK